MTTPRHPIPVFGNHVSSADDTIEIYSPNHWHENSLKKIEKANSKAAALGKKDVTIILDISSRSVRGDLLRNLLRLLRNLLRLLRDVACCLLVVACCGYEVLLLRKRLRRPTESEFLLILDGVCENIMDLEIKMLKIIVTYKFIQKVTKFQKNQEKSRKSMKKSKSVTSKSVTTDGHHFS